MTLGYFFFRQINCTWESEEGNAILCSNILQNSALYHRNSKVQDFGMTEVCVSSCCFPAEFMIPFVVLHAKESIKIVN